MSTINIYPDAILDNPPTEFGDDIDVYCNEIHDACKGWGTDEDAVVAAFASKTQDQMFQIYYRYKEMFDKDLRDVMRKEMGRGDLSLALQLLALPADAAEALMIKKATDGVGARERLLYPILCGRSNAEIAKLKEEYFKQYDDDLAVKLNKELDDDFEKFIFHCLQGSEEEYDPEYHTPEKAEQDADAFYDAGQGKFFGTDEKSIFEIICKSPPEHLKNVNTIYEEKYANGILKALDKEMGGDIEKAVQFAVGMKMDPYKTVAELVKRACQGFGTDEISLSFTVIRYRKILKEVNEAHIELYEQSITDRIKEECGGKYEALLVGVVDAATA